jgi:SprT protein
MRGTVECLAAVDYYLDLLQTKAGIYLPRPRVKFELRGTVAGRAYYSKNLIQFNPILLDENPEHFVKQTVGHEVAHLAAFVKHGGQIRPHGSEWSRVMWALGLPAKRCHNYDISTVTGRRPKSLAIEIT